MLGKKFEVLCNPRSSKEEVHDVKKYALPLSKGGFDHPLLHSPQKRIFCNLLFV